MSKIDITSTTVEKGLDMIKGFVKKLTGGSIEEAGLLFADKIRLRRLSNQIKILNKAKLIAQNNNIDVKQINLKILVPLLDYCSLEEEETLQEKWANLIANYADAKNIYESTIFPYILSQLSTNEILILEDIYRDDMSSAMLNKIDYNNLIRLGILEKQLPIPKLKNLLMSGHAEIEYDKNNVQYEITDLGSEFIFCCNPSLKKNK